MKAGIIDLNNVKVAWGEFQNSIAGGVFAVGFIRWFPRSRMGTIKKNCIIHLRVVMQSYSCRVLSYLPVQNLGPIIAGLDPEQRI